MANPSTRLLNLILLLQQRPNMSASRLAEALDVSVRTVQRYIIMLEDMGVPIYAERGALGGYSLVRGYRMPPLIFSAEEAVALYLGTNLLGTVWGKLFRNSALSAMTKIENVLPSEQLQEITWAKASLITGAMPRVNPSLDINQLEALYQAARQRQQVEISYKARQQRKAVQRRIDPYALVYSWGQQYCIAYCHLRDALRSFRVDRIETLKVLDISFIKPDDFDPSQHLHHAERAQTRQEVRLHFSAESAVMARDYGRCWDSFDEQPDGSVIAGFFASDLDTATHRVMCFLAHAQIISPQALQEKVRQAALAIAAQYES